MPLHGPPPDETPFALLGGEDVVRQLTELFYDAMDEHEPALARLHRLDDDGKVHPEARRRFGLFLMGWLGGPQDYVASYGHPRLRMRHARVRVDAGMRDAWLRCMTRALDQIEIEDRVRAFLDHQLAHTADFLVNAPDADAP